MFPFMFPAERFEGTEAQVERLLALSGVTGGDVLDLACGPGRHSVALAQRGFRVTGVDRTTFLLSKARERADDAGVTVEYVQQDMRDFCRPDSFDLALSMFTSFGYFDHVDEDRLVLSNLRRSLRPGGVLVMDVAGKEVLARVFEHAGVQVAPDGRKLMQHRQVRPGWRRLSVEWTIIDGNSARSFAIEHTIYSGWELQEMMLAAGFAEARVYGGLDGQPYDDKASRLVAVARA
jgi:SAM-dependent methyltransferase